MSNVAIASQRGSFWQRQFAEEATVKQNLFDIFVGVFLPLGCLIFDPVVFRSLVSAAPLLGRYQIHGYCAIGLEMCALAVWIYVRRPAAFLAGVLFAGACLAFGMGLVMLPYSLLGLIAIIGFLGFTPFFTAFVFLRNAIRAWRLARRTDALAAAAIATIGFFTISCVDPLAQSYIDHTVANALKMVMSSNQEEVAQGIAELNRYRFAANLDELVWKYAAEENGDRKTELARIYREVTYRDIEMRLYILND